MAPRAPSDIRGQRPEDLDAGPLHRLSRLAAARFGARAIGIGDQEASEDAERRIAEEAAAKQLLVGERIGIEDGGGPDGVMRWRVGLDDDAPRTRPARPAICASS